jgi:hypothetical protein
MTEPVFRSWRYTSDDESHAAWKAMYDAAVAQSESHGVGLWRTKRSDRPDAHYVFLMDYSDGYKHVAICEPLAGDGIPEDVDRPTQLLLAGRHLRVGMEQGAGESVRMHHGEDGKYLWSDGIMRDDPEPRASRR